MIKYNFLIDIQFRLFLGLFLYFLIVPILFADYSFKLEKSEILLGEPLYAQFEFTGSPEIVPLQKIIKDKDLSVEFLNIEQQITSINFKVSKKKILKYRIIVSRPGTYSLPKIELNVDGKVVSSDPVSFTVKNEKYSPPKRPKSIFDRFFSDPHIGARSYIEPSEDDLHISFYTEPSSVYVGESIIGFYKVLYKNMQKPNVERNYNHNIEFKFFSAEMLNDVGIKLNFTEERDGIAFHTFPYGKEVYALTPLKSGTFNIGEAYFETEGNIETYFSVRPLLAYPTKVRVKPLPANKPSHFSGEVGIYEIEGDISKTKVYLDESILFNLTIKGEGNLSMVKNPIELSCSYLNNCEFDYILFKTNNQKNFQKLSSGKYGFYSTITFQYSILPKKEGSYSPTLIEFSYFNPDKETYQNTNYQIPSLEVSKPLLKETEEVYTPKEKKFKWIYIAYIVLSFSVIFLLYYYKNIIIHITGGILDFFNISIRPISPKDVIYIDELIGNKKGMILKNVLMNKGLNSKKISEILLLKKAAGNETLLDLYKKSDNLQKDYLLKLTKEIIKENKL